MAKSNSCARAQPLSRFRLATCAAALLVIGACDRGDSATDLVRSTGAAWEEAYNQRDVERLGRTYAEDAVSMAPGAPAKKGREAIIAELSSILSQFNPHHESTVEELIIQGDIAVERAAYRDRLTPVSGGDAIVEEGKHVVVYRRDRSGEWKILWEIWNLDQ